MKTKCNYLGTANYSESIYEFEYEIEWLELQISPSKKRFNQGKCDALFLMKPKFENFDYLCGWHWQTEKLIQESEKFTLDFGEF